MYWARSLMPLLWRPEDNFREFQSTLPVLPAPTWIRNVSLGSLVTEFGMGAAFILGPEFSTRQRQNSHLHKSYHPMRTHIKKRFGLRMAQSVIACLEGRNTWVQPQNPHQTWTEHSILGIQRWWQKTLASQASLISESKPVRDGISKERAGFLRILLLAVHPHRCEHANTRTYKHMHIRTKTKEVKRWVGRQRCWLPSLTWVWSLGPTW